jgi:cellulose synthase/poly-beta-1,6-N-acetylglucosamine synthase-like glycosyltransferase
MTLAYCVALIVAAVSGTGALHDGVVNMAMLIAIVAIIRQVLILLFSYLYRRREKSMRQSAVDAELTPHVSIIVPAYNEAAVIESALRSMLCLSYPNYEVLLVDDGSTDDTFQLAQSMVAEFDGRLRVFRQANQGKSVALNLGIRISRSSLVLCVDADSTLQAEGLQHAVRHFTDSQVAAVAGVVEVRLGKGKFISRLQRTEYLMSQRLTRAAVAFFRCIPIVPGPAGLFRRQALVDAGGYISAQDCFAEDAELTIRLLAEGHDIVSEPRLVSVTEAPVDLFSLLRQRYRWSRGSIQALFLNARNLVFSCSARGPVLFLYLLAETIFLPTLCFGAALFFLANTLVYGEVTTFALGLIVLVGLEVFGLMLVSESKRQFPVYLVEYLLIRFFYAYILTAWTLMCMRDEMSSIRMSWDKLDRQGVEN